MASVFRKKKKKPLFDTGPEAFNLLLKEAVVREFLDEQVGNVYQSFSLVNIHSGHPERYRSNGNNN